MGRLAVAAHRLIFLAKFMDFSIVECFKIEHRLLCGFRSTDKLVELHVDDVVVPVLGILDQEDHQECDDGGRRINDELPGVVVVKPGPGCSPCGNQYHGDQEGTRFTGVVSEQLAEVGEFHDDNSNATYRF